MSQFAVLHIAESMSTAQSNTISLEDCIIRAQCAGTGAFCIGSSAGVATQVRFAKYLPRPLRALLIIPAVFGLGTARAMYRYSSNECIQRLEQWAEPSQYEAHADSG